MKIAIVGAGYVGLVSGTCFAEMGAEVVCIDSDPVKIEKLKKGEIPIYEPNLDIMLERNVKDGRLRFSTKLQDYVNEVEVIFCAVGTPSEKDGTANLSYVFDVARTIGMSMNKYALIVMKSTVPVGTSAKIEEIIKQEQKKRGVDIPFDVASNPEFLKEGNAIKDFMSPDRVVVGIKSEKAKNLMIKLYRPLLLKSFRILFTDVSSAEMIKYASNAMLATRISFMNDIANLCDLVGADVNVVRQGMGADNRIGNMFLYPGCGYGGSCFPKDIRALIKTAETRGYEMKVLKAVEKVNQNQKKILFEKLLKFYENDIEGKTITLWGLSFKPETDDMREATSLVIIDLLLKHKCKIKAYDPVAMKECRKIVGDKIEYCSDMYDASKKTDAILLITEWKQFRMPDWNRLKEMVKNHLIIDGRNIYIKKEVEEYGFKYLSIGGK